MDDKCQCSLRIRLTGDGCRYCQPQEYIDRLHDNAKEDHAEIERQEARIAELEAALRPFAKMAAKSRDWGKRSDASLVSTEVQSPYGHPLSWVTVTVGDFRRAAAALGGDDADR
jgi:cell division septum initiation protein DivIVA